VTFRRSSGSRAIRFLLGSADGDPSWIPSFDCNNADLDMYCSQGD
jgi:hypothetical protein